MWRRPKTSLAKNGIMIFASSLNVFFEDGRVGIMFWGVCSDDEGGVWISFLFVGLDCLD